MNETQQKDVINAVLKASGTGYVVSDQRNYAFKAGTTVNEQLLRESQLVRGDFEGIKILGGGELKHALTIEADKISESAKTKIEKAGGTVTMRDPSAQKAESKPKANAVVIDMHSTR